MRVVVEVAAAEAGGFDGDLGFGSGGWGEGARFLAGLARVGRGRGGGRELTTRRSLAPWRRRVLVDLGSWTLPIVSVGCVDEI
jgi:hypothetical protein